MAVRTILLIRHGQYHLDQEHPRYGRLTPLGERQGRRLARRLALCSLDALYSSIAPRAIETAQQIREQLRAVPYKATRLLLEGLPTALPGFTAEQRRRVPAHRARMDRVFTRYFRPTRGRDRVEALVCHGNIIRYLLRRALGDSAHKWTLFETNHCGISSVVIRADGTMRIAGINDVGHLPRKLQTFE